MGITVVLDIFSGVKNPVWELTVEHEKSVISHINSTRISSGENIPFDLLGLGYRGFKLEISEEGVNRQAIVFSNRIFFVETGETFINEKIEDILLDSFSELESKDFIKEIKLEIDTSEIKLKNALTAEEFNPGMWNNDSHIKKNNNCYNYASNRITNTFAQPGRGGGGIFNGIYCGNINLGVERDGWAVGGALPVTEEHMDENDYSMIFALLVVWEQRDFHWYRLDKNKLWSHKPGNTNAINTDNSGQLISNPRDCNRGHYTRLCSLWRTPLREEWLTIR